MGHSAQHVKHENEQKSSPNSSPNSSPESLKFIVAISLWGKSGVTSVQFRLLQSPGMGFWPFSKLLSIFFRFSGPKQGWGILKFPSCLHFTKQGDMCCFFTNSSAKICTSQEWGQTQMGSDGSSRIITKFYFLGSVGVRPAPSQTQESKGFGPDSNRTFTRISMEAGLKALPDPLFPLTPSTQDRRGAKGRAEWSKGNDLSSRNPFVHRACLLGHVRRACLLGQCPSTVRPVFPVLVFQLSKQQNSTRTTSSIALGTPPNRTRTRKLRLEEHRGGCLVSWVPKWEFTETWHFRSLEPYTKPCSDTS